MLLMNVLSLGNGGEKGGVIPRAFWSVRASLDFECVNKLSVFLLLTKIGLKMSS